MSEPVVIEAIRTPFGRREGAFREVRPDADVNLRGGAISHGHPSWATGGGPMAEVVGGLEVTGGRLGLQVMCIGHGTATATVVERI